jgi:hypothetical protein
MQNLRVKLWEQIKVAEHQKYQKVQTPEVLECILPQMSSFFFKWRNSP